MHIEVQHGPAYALAIAHLGADESLVAEAGAMVSHDANVAMETSTNATGKKKGGLLGGLKRALAGESFFQNKFTANGGAGTVTLAPTHCGDVVVQELGQRTLFLQSTAFICSGMGVEIDAKWGGARTFFGGEGLIMLKATGSGPIAFNAFGGIKEIDVDGTFVVDTGHIVAFEEGVEFSVNRFGGGWKSFIFGGEGLVCTFSGRGKVWIQTRNPQAYGEAVGGKLPPRD